MWRDSVDHDGPL